LAPPSHSCCRVRVLPEPLSRYGRSGDPPPDTNAATLVPPQSGMHVSPQQVLEQKDPGSHSSLVVHVAPQDLLPQTVGPSSAVK
jgi:hypothetical protein